MMMMMMALGFCLNTYHAREEGQGTCVLTAGNEPVTFGKIPGDIHISGNVLS